MSELILEKKKNLIPNTWTKVQLVNISKKIVDGVHKTPNYISKGIPFLSIYNIDENSNLTFKNCKFISKSEYK